MADLMNDYPLVADLARRARRRIPHFAWEYLDSGTGAETLLDLNERALAAVRLMPRFARGRFAVDMTTTLFGRDWSAPFGVAPVGMTGLLWPDGEHMLARMAARHAIPYTLSTVACEAPETVGPLAARNGWFQLYPPEDTALRDDLIDRVKQAGFTALMVTADLPVPSMRERQRRAGLRMPPNPGPRTLLHIGMRPRWALATARHGAPRFKVIAKYADADTMDVLASLMATQLTDCLDWDYVAAVRARWDGPLIIKGLLDPDDARAAVAHGADGIVVSNHGGRQFDAAPAAIDALPAIAEAVGDKAAVLFDSGVRGGLDIARALALGADFVLLGRAFMFGLAAFGEDGCDHVAALLKADLENNMKQLGVATIVDLRGAAWKRDQS